MEKAIIKTIIYADIFDFPLTIQEIHKWLINKKTQPRYIEKALKNPESRIQNQGEYYFLEGRKSLVRQRINKQKYSYIYIKKAKVISWFLKLIPWIKLVGISGGLAMENAGKQDDIDLFIICSKQRLWISRLFTLIILSILGQRRRKSDSKKQAAGKICANLFLEEDQLEQKNKDLFTAHEVLQMKVLWQRGGIYSKYLSDNQWVFKFLPNWVGDKDLRFRNIDLRKKNLKSYLLNPKSILNNIEDWARGLQLRYMGKPSGGERISEGAVYFHPEDLRNKVLERYRDKIASKAY
jgi:hypothetical protein